jgi:hypothetical protein
MGKSSLKRASIEDHGIFHVIALHTKDQVSMCQALQETSSCENNGGDDTKRKRLITV